MGGETQDVEVSALKKTGLDKLDEAILLQSEILDLRANPERAAEGSVIESRLDRGRGPVATVLVQKGTLHQGDIVVAGAEWGRVRAMLDDKGAPAQGRRPVDAGRDPRPCRRARRGRAVRGGGERRPGARDQRVPAAQDPREGGRRRLRRARAGRSTRCWRASRPASRRKSRSSSRPTCRAAARRSRPRCSKLATEEVKVRVVLAGVGQITESDMQLAVPRTRNRGVQRARHRAGARPRPARWRRYPLLLDHLRAGG